MLSVTTTTAPPALPDLVDFDELCDVLRLGRTAARTRTYDDDFPQPFVLSAGCYRWDRAELLTWLNGRRTKLVRRARANEAVPTPQLVFVPAPVAVTKRGVDR